MVGRDKSLAIIHPPTSKVVIRGKMDGILFKLQGQAVNNFSEALHVNSNKKLFLATLWHARMGHIGMEKLRSVSSNLKWLPKIRSKPLKCEACIMAKFSRKPFVPSKW